MKAKWEEYKKNFGKEYVESEYVFTWQDGSALKPDYISSSFKKVLKTNNLPDMRSHDLRHSCASILYDRGWKEKDLQKWMRHADIQTTLGIYTHISDFRKELIAKDLEGLFKSAG